MIASFREGKYVGIIGNKRMDLFDKVHRKGMN